MPFKTADRVKETTTTTGTGDVTLLGAAVGFLSFSQVLANGDQCYYCIQSQSGGEWEIGQGQMQSATVLQRFSTFTSSNANSPVNFSAGVKDVFITDPATFANSWRTVNGFEIGIGAYPLSATPAPGMGILGLQAAYVGESPKLFSFDAKSAYGTMYQPHLALGNVGLFIPVPNATTATVIGMGVATATGTATARTVAATNFVTRRRRIGYVSTGTASSLCGLHFTQATGMRGDGTSREGGFILTIRFAITDATMQTGALFFAGVSTATGAPTAVDPSTLTNCIGVVKRAADTNFFLYWAGSASNAANIVDTGIPCNDPLQVYELCISTQMNFGHGSACFGMLFTNIVTTFSYGDFRDALPATQIFGATALVAPRIWRTSNATTPAVAGIDILGLSFESTL